MTTTLDTATRARIHAYAAQLVAAAPALTQETRARLAELLTAGGDKR